MLTESVLAVCKHVLVYNHTHGVSNTWSSELLSPHHVVPDNLAYASSLATQHAYQAVPPARSYCQKLYWNRDIHLCLLCTLICIKLMCNVFAGDALMQLLSCFCETNKSDHICDEVYMFAVVVLLFPEMMQTQLTWVVNE